MKLALQWIRDNIGYFGGHRRLISVVSTGLGASLASVLSMSPSIENKNFSEGKGKRLQLVVFGSAVPGLGDKITLRFRADSDLSRRLNLRPVPDTATASEAR